MTPASRVMIGLLLLLQVWIGFARGQAMCIPIGPCGQHQGEHPAAPDVCDHSHDHDHHHGFIPPHAHQHGDCGCHVHVPPQDDPQTPASRFATLDLSMKFVAVVCAVEWPEFPAVAPAGWTRPPDRACPRLPLGLRTTRLLI